MVISHSEMAKLHSASPREITSPLTREIISVLHSKACNNLYIFHSYSCNKLYMLSVCRSMSVVCQINCVGGITCGPCACSKSFFGG